MTEALQPGHQVSSSKLRKSCDSCAATKVGCNKEKPKCARCAKHGQPCVYSAARRAGRTSGASRAQAKRNDNLSKATAPISPTSTMAPALNNTTISSAPSGVAAFSPSLAVNTRRQCSPSNTDFFETLNSPGDASMFSMPSNSFTDLDELSTSAVAFLGNPPEGDTSSASLFDFNFDDFSDHSSSNFTNISSLFPGSGEADASPSSRTSTSSNHGSVVARPIMEDVQVPITSQASHAGQVYQSESACQCLARTLSLLARLSPGTSGCWNPGADSGASPNPPDIQRVLAQNEQTREEIRMVLQCSCSSDSYLLVTLSLVIFKIIAWYTAAASAASGEDPNPNTSCSAEWQSRQRPAERVPQVLSMNRSGYDSEGEDQQRIVVQSILSKLAGVQVLVDQLSQRLPRVWNNTDGIKVADSPFENASAPSILAGGDALRRPFSTELAHTLEADLRKRLYELSQAIVERLRQG